ncbi:hypothetical protein DEO72_LG8g1971 [Vigna unguiculata]|uniref:Uncharacterized protein n=1 Tax=Vigna unguiculata TaxID=3917 RepID=A0A4D6MV07_VIGUN|nr:hypothetical protein DEO72_LG8g1971 [Vigna unguiculata]
MVARAWFRWCAEMENGDGGVRNKLPWWPKVGKWWNCGGGASRWHKVELLVRESRRWSKTAVAAVEVDGGG